MRCLRLHKVYGLKVGRLFFLSLDGGMLKFTDAFRVNGFSLNALNGHIHILLNIKNTTCTPM